MNKTVYHMCLYMSVCFALVFSLMGCSSSPNQSESATSSAANQSQTSKQEQSDAVKSEEQTESSSPKSKVDSYSWEQLSVIADEISNASSKQAALEIAKQYNLTNSSGKLDGNQTKDVILSNGMKESVQIAGFYHDDKTDGGKAGITFIFANAIVAQPMNETDTCEGGWKDSELRGWLASKGFETLPFELQKAIVAVDKRTNNVGETQKTSSVTTTSDKLWLYSTVELCGDVNWTWSLRHGGNKEYNEVVNSEGFQYQLFKDMNVESRDSNEILEKKAPGTSNWWCRTPDPFSGVAFCGVTNYGCPSVGAGDAGTPGGVAPGFCL